MSQKSVKFHIKSDDYFGTLATILSLIRQSNDNHKNLNILKRLEKDLLFLQKKYKIINKYEKN